MGRTRIGYSRALRSRAFQRVSRQGLEWLESSRLTRLGWLVHAFSTRRGGVSRPPAAGLNLGFSNADRRSRVEANRRLFLEALGAGEFSLAELRQVHSAAIYQAVATPTGNLKYRPRGSERISRAAPRAPRGPGREGRKAGDALLTDEPGILLSVRSADCVPVLLVDPRKRAVAALHAGWRGALERVAERTLREMRRELGSRPPDILAVIGPSIRACCYEVGEEVHDAFLSRFVVGERFFRKPTQPSAIAGRHPLGLLTAEPPGHGTWDAPRVHLDLAAVARAQLEGAGVPPANIEVAEFCTACRTDLFFSYRKEGSRTGRMMAVVGIRP